MELHVGTKLESDDSSAGSGDIHIEGVTIYSAIDPNVSRTISGVDTQEVRVPVNDLPSGVYVIETRSSECGTKTTQFLKQ